MPRKVYLTPDQYKHSRHHTAYTGEGVSEGKPGRLVKVEFVNGIAKNVEEGTYQRVKDAGLADVNRPRRAGDDD